MARTVEDKSYVGRRVAKNFGGEVYLGLVANFVKKQRLWGIKYDDGDAEELDWDELAAALALHDKANNNCGSKKKSLAKAAKKVTTPAQKKAPAKKTKATPKKSTPKSIPKSAATPKEAVATPRTIPVEKSLLPNPTCTNHHSTVSEVRQAPPPPAPVAKKSIAKTETPEPKEPEAKKPSAKEPEAKKPESKKKKAETPDAPIEEASKPVAKKAKTTSEKAAPPQQKKKKTTPAEDIANDPSSVVQRRIAKNFDGVPYFGTVREYDDAESPAFWHVEYDDGDQEDYSEEDLIRALKLYGVKGKKDPNRTKGKK